MEQLIEFSMHHIYLVGIFIVLLFLFIYVSFSSSGGVKSVSPIEVTSLLNHENAIIIDVREQIEFDKGHILNSKHIPIKNITDQIDKLKKKYVEKPVIVGCQSGYRSVSICKQLVKAGFERVYNLDGGIAAWQSASMPMRKNQKS